MAELDYAVIGNGAIASLIDKKGRHVWCCYPRLDGDPLFHALLGGDTPERGYFEAVLADFDRAEQYYLANSAIVETLLHDRHGGTVRITDFCPRLCPLGRTAARLALQPDAGLWEFRTRESVHTFSAAMCWAALSRLGLIARAVGETAEAEAWETQAATLRDEILSRMVVPGEGWISGVLDTPVLDASVLLLPEIGMIAATSTEFLKTLDVMETRLMRDGFLLRYEAPDDFGPPETAFLICSFWYVNALAMAGRHEAARALFETILAHRNHVGLLSEDLDTKTGALWGNFPQTYSQVGLILSATRLSRSWEDGLWRGLL